MRALMWFRGDLRVRDNTALHNACRRAGGKSGGGVVAVFTVCPKQWLKEHDWADIKVGFILRNLTELQTRLAKLNIPLKIITTDDFGGVPKKLLELAVECGCDELFFNDEYEVNEAERDRAVEEAFRERGLQVRRYTDLVLIAPGRVRTKEGKAYTVYTPFKKNVIAQLKERMDEGEAPGVLPEPSAQAETGTDSDGIPESVDGFDLDKDRPDLWAAGETHAARVLGQFCSRRLDVYKDQRDTPAINGTSTLSPHLAVGVLSPRQCLAAALEQNQNKLDSGSKGAVHWISELLWRDFYKHIAAQFPHVVKGHSFRREYDDMEWDNDDAQFEAWCEGRTGYPIVDAAMRQMNETGWMHNRCRMIVAMFLTKHLFQDWRRGERYFMRHLVDGDFASNNGGWQWSASTGTDAAPYFRIYNPTTQGQRHDPDGVYIRKFVEELKEIEGDAVHEPHAEEDLFSDLEYPKPIVDNKAGRERAIGAFKSFRD